MPKPQTCDERVSRRAPEEALDARRPDQREGRDELWPREVALVAALLAALLAARPAKLTARAARSPDSPRSCPTPSVW
jgi:hypothetical protein